MDRTTFKWANVSTRPSAKATNPPLVFSRCRKREEGRCGAGGDVYQEGVGPQGPSMVAVREESEVIVVKIARLGRRRLRCSGCGQASRCGTGRSSSSTGPTVCALGAAVGAALGPRDDLSGPRRGAARPQALVGGGGRAFRARLEDRSGDHPRGHRHRPEAAPLAPAARPLCPRIPCKLRVGSTDRALPFVPSRCVRLTASSIGKTRLALPVLHE